MSSGFIINLEGLISVGKTTLGKSLEVRGHFLGRPVIFIPEYQNNEFLDLYLSDQAKYAFSFQSVALKERMNTHRYAEQLAQQGYCVIIDRGLAGDLSFALMQRDRGYFNESEWKAYWSLICEHQASPFQPDLVVYLECDPELALIRLRQRGNQNEINCYNQEYFSQLQDSHERAFVLYDQLPRQISLLRIDWSQPKLIQKVHLKDTRIGPSEDNQLSSTELNQFERIVTDHLLKNVQKTVSPMGSNFSNLQPKPVEVSSHH